MRETIRWQVTSVLIPVSSPLPRPSRAVRRIRTHFLPRRSTVACGQIDLEKEMEHERRSHTGSCWKKSRQTRYFFPRDRFSIDSMSDENTCPWLTAAAVRWKDAHTFLLLASFHEGTDRNSPARHGGYNLLPSVSRRITVPWRKGAKVTVFSLETRLMKPKADQAHR